MKKFIIIPDVTCDLCGEIREKFGVTEYIKGYINIDGEELQTTLDWTNITRDKFYKLLGNKKVTISSAVASPDEYYQVFAPYAKEGYDILSISLSSKIPTLRRDMIFLAFRFPPKSALHTTPQWQPQSALWRISLIAE